MTVEPIKSLFRYVKLLTVVIFFVKG